VTRVHICLVSGQPIPNLIPLKMEGLRPEKVILLVSPDMAVGKIRNLSGWRIRPNRSNYPSLLQNSYIRNVLSFP
jgi:hypothetical protein